MSTENEARAAFLAGEGTLTGRQVREWLLELEPPWLDARALMTYCSGISEDEPLMVSVLKNSSVEEHRALPDVHAGLRA